MLGYGLSRLFDWIAGMENTLKIEGHQEGTVTVISLAGRMDAQCTNEFEIYSENLIAEGNRKVIIDLSGLDYLSSAGLRSFLSLTKLLKSIDGRLVLCGVKGMVQDVFVITGFERVLEMCPSKEEALGALG